MRHFCVLLLVGLSSLGSTLAATPTTPIMFVGQVPIQGDFGSMASTFGNQAGNLSAAPRGGGLFIRYPDGMVKDLTAAAGYGLANGMQGANAIAVRDPHLHWSGKKALFSMVIGAPTQRYQVGEYFWQMYQVTGLGENETPIITKIANQPLNRNNIYPFYNSKGSILFVSDAPAVGNAQHLYPPLDEYELSPINSGIWILNTSTGSLRLINHAPSGDFKPFVDHSGITYSVTKKPMLTQWGAIPMAPLITAVSPPPQKYCPAKKKCFPSHAHPVLTYWLEHQSMVISLISFFHGK